MGSRRTTVLAAGGVVVVRRNSKVVIAVVQRKRDHAWVLPKGKIKQNEKPITAAKREAIEETGCAVRVCEFLGVISYLSGDRPKIAHFWRMQATGNAATSPTEDIKGVEWLPLSKAIGRLSLPHEQSFLRSVGHHVSRRTKRRAGF